MRLLISLLLTTLTGCTSVSHFNSLAEQEEKESGDVLPYLDLKAGESIADLGAGGGYFSFKLARAVGESGKVYAVDIDPQSISFIKRESAEKGIRNVETVLATLDDSMLGKASVDVIFLRNAYHDFANRVPYFTRLKSALKPGGRVVIIDYDPSKLGFVRKLFGHALDERTILTEMESAGYRRKMSHTILKQQSFNVFVAGE